jgi:hypothetical protein
MRTIICSKYFKVNIQLRANILYLKKYGCKDAVKNILDEDKDYSLTVVKCMMKLQFLQSLRISELEDML